MPLSTPELIVPMEHATLVFEREIAGPVEAVFEAFANAEARATWGVPSPNAVILYDSENFAVGGEDRYRCGSRDDPNIHATTHYLEIVSNQRIVFSETLAVDGQRLCAALTSIELTPGGSSTKLKSTTQVASFVGEPMIQGYTDGNNASLDNLVRYMQQCDDSAQP